MADEPNTNQDANAADGGERTGGEQGTQFTEERVRAEIAKALESNEAYKGLQRAFNKSNGAYQQQLAVKDAEIAALKSQTSEMAEGLDFLSNKFIRALPPEQQATMADELRQRKITSLEKEVSQMRQVLSAPRSEPQAPQLDQEQLEAQMRVILREAQDSLEETAKDRGFDPKDKELDYGTEAETFAARLRKLNASINKLAKEREKQDLEGVKPKAGMTPTRTTGGQAVGDAFAGQSFWDIGAKEVWDRISLEARTGKRR